MAKPPKAYPVIDSGDLDHVAVVIHGIRQTYRGLSGFAHALARHTPGIDIELFDYDWTQSLETSGRDLARRLAELRHRRISLVGYSMGGLVARVAAADHANPRVTSVVTLATPNYGALGTAQLLALGQEVVGGLRLISPLFQCPGVMDLTRASELMRSRRARAEVRAAVADKRYASVPALYFHPDRSWRDLGTGMGLAAGVLAATGLTRIPRPNDGIVSEDSNDVTLRSGTRWAEFDVARYDGQRPAHCHAHHAAAIDLDHMSVLDSEKIAELVGRLLLADNWTDLRDVDDDLRLKFVSRA